MITIRRAIAALAVPMLAGTAQAKGAASPRGCMMTATAPTQAVENAGAAMPRGATWGPATQMRIGLADGRVSYCAHGDYCFPADHLRFVTPCTPDATPMPATAGDTDRLYALRDRPSQ